MNHPDIDRMERTGMRPGERVNRWDGECITVHVMVAIFRDELDDDTEDAQHAIEQAEQIVRDALNGHEYEITSSEVD